jgi:hypothetical protein
MRNYLILIALLAIVATSCKRVRRSGDRTTTRITTPAPKIVKFYIFTSLTDGSLIRVENAIENSELLKIGGEYMLRISYEPRGEGYLYKVQSEKITEFQYFTFADDSYEKVYPVSLRATGIAE